MAAFVLLKLIKYQGTEVKDRLIEIIPKILYIFPLPIEVEDDDLVQYCAAMVYPLLFDLWIKKNEILLGKSDENKSMIDRILLEAAEKNLVEEELKERIFASLVKEYKK